MKKIITILCLCFFLTSSSKNIFKDESLKIFLEGSWVRRTMLTTNFEPSEFIFDKDNSYTSYTIFSDDKSIYYGFDNGILKDYLESYIQYDKIKIPFIDYTQYRLLKSHGIVFLGFDGWEDIVEAKGIWRIVPLSKDKIRIIFSEENPYVHETYIRLDPNELPYYLKEILD